MSPTFKASRAAPPQSPDSEHCWIEWIPTREEVTPPALENLDTPQNFRIDSEERRGQCFNPSGLAETTTQGAQNAGFIAPYLVDITSVAISVGSKEEVLGFTSVKSAQIA
jgi:hypothetical protein